MTVFVVNDDNYKRNQHKEKLGYGVWGQKNPWMCLRMTYWCRIGKMYTKKLILAMHICAIIW